MVLLSLTRPRKLYTSVGNFFAPPMHNIIFSVFFFIKLPRHRRVRMCVSVCSCARVCMCVTKSIGMLL